MANVPYQQDLATLLGLRNWENAEAPRVYWGATSPQILKELGYQFPNAGYFGQLEGGGGGFGSYAPGGGGQAFSLFGALGDPGAASSFAAPQSTRISNFAVAPNDFGSASAEGGDPGGYGTGAPPGTGRQMATRETEDPVDMAVSIGRGLGVMSGALGLPSLMLAERNRSQTQPYSLSDLNPLKGSALGSLADLLGFGGGIGDFNQASANPGAVSGSVADVVGAGGLPGGMEAGGQQPGGGGPDMSGFGSDVNSSGGGEYAGGEAPGSFARGGPVRMSDLVGPNPRGPDDGSARLDAGEHVIAADEVKKAGGHKGVARYRRGLREGTISLREIAQAAKR